VGAWGQQSPFKPYEHRALYLYNFAKFTKWPDSAFANERAPFIIGILGRDPFEKDIAIVEGKPIKGRTVEVRRFESLERLGPCHILYISDSEKAHLSDVLQRVKGSPVLTVGEMDSFLASGGMVNLIPLENKTLTFDINLPVAEGAGLKLDTRFLRLAHQVKTE
jgi:hypothetical protein